MRAYSRLVWLNRAQNCKLLGSKANNEFPVVLVHSLEITNYFWIEFYCETYIPCPEVINRLPEHERKDFLKVLSEMCGGIEDN